MDEKYADSQLTLIPTPHKVTSKTDVFTMGASRVTIVHNAIVRGYNSTYKQVPYIRPHNNEMVLDHHQAEEEVLFPALEQESGVARLMDVDKHEHEAFYGGLGEFNKYLTMCANTSDPPATFSGTRLVEIMDNFGPALHSHLSSEPSHIASLSKYPNIDMPVVTAKTENDAMNRTSPLYVLPIMWFNLDVEFEDGNWRKFPGLSAPLRWIMVNVLGWHLGSAGSDGKLLPLLALREDY